MIMGVCIILIFAFCVAMAYVEKRYQTNDESDTGFLVSLFVLTLFAIGLFFLLCYVYNFIKQ